MKGKMVRLTEGTHRELKILAAETGRHVSGDLLEDVIRFGMEEVRRNFPRKEKNNPQGVTA